MKLNYDCVRDVLLSLEELLTCEYSNEIFVFNEISIEELYEKLSDKNYRIEDVLYSVNNLEQAGFIKADFLSADGGIVCCDISNITYEGHQFLQNIRPKKVWDKSKSIFQNIGTISVDIIKSVTSTVITDTINHYLPKNSSSTQTP